MKQFIAECRLRAEFNSDYEDVNAADFGNLTDITVIDSGIIEGIYRFKVKAYTSGEARIFARSVYEKSVNEGTVEVGDLKGSHYWLVEIEDGIEFRIAE